MSPVLRIDRPFATRAFAAAIAAIAWSALILQYVLLLDATRVDLGPLQATLRFFSFFTVLSNLLVALTTSCALAATHSTPDRFLGGDRVRGAAVLCIGVTCGIYHFVLAATWFPHGAQRVADVVLHYLVPALYVLWWLACAAHGRLVWSDALRWLLLPLAFLLWVLLRGGEVHEYPYPFLDVDALGLGTVLRNAFAIGALFLLAGLALVAFDRGLRRTV